MPEYIYPSSAELRAVEQVKLPRLVENRLGFEIFPLEERDDYLLVWEQEDDYTGLQQLRGLNGEPTRVKRVGAKRYIMEPGVYGEFTTIDEMELTRRRPYGQMSGSIDLSDLTMSAQDQLLERRLDRIEYIIWLLATTGTFAVSNADGTVSHTDTYSLQTFTSGVPWATVATATPLADFRAVQLLARGKGVSFGAQSVAYLNQVTLNRLLSNTNANDIAGRRTAGLASVANLADVNTILLGEGLPQLRVYDEGYLNDAGTFVPYIADGKVAVKGRRINGAQLGAYRMVRNANNPNMEPGAYTKVVDHDDDVPRTIEVHDGHNGGPVVFFPSGLVIMNV